MAEDAIVLFNNLACQGYTLRGIRRLMKAQGHDLKGHSDTSLLRRQLATLRARGDQADAD